jgi:hypothetical protein
MKRPPGDSSNWDYRVYDCETDPTEFGVFEPVVRLWNAKRIAGRLPVWRDFELPDFAGWYGWVSVCDVTYEPIFDTHYRLWGTKVADILGYEMSGRSPRRNSEPPFEYDGGYSQVEMDFLEELARKPAIGITSGSIHWQNRDHVSYEEITLPLADDGETVDRLLFAINPIR